MDTVDGESRRQPTRVFKKPSNNGKITVYLSKHGVVLIDPEYVKERKVFGNVLAHLRFGREDLDVLGLIVKRELHLATDQIYPPTNEEQPQKLTRLQERLIKKLGKNAYPFYFKLPPNSPASVTLQPAICEPGKAYGVDYELIVFVGENKDGRPLKRSTVRLAIRKIMYAPSRQGEQPSIEVSKEFLMSRNRLHLEASLDKELYHHGENIEVNVHIANNSNRTVKKIKVSVRQFADIYGYSSSQYKCTVAETESAIGVAPGFTLSKVFFLKPTLADNKDKRGLALDGQLKHEDTNLASSTMEGCTVGPGFTLSKVFTVVPRIANSKNKWALALDGKLKHQDTNLASSTLNVDPSQRENLGVIVQYKVKVKLCLGALGGELVAELPFILMHPKPEEETSSPVTVQPSSTNPSENGECANDTNLIQLDTEDDVGNDDIIFEDFARLRLKGETDA
ncbi:Similar to ARRB1: Beta-arrestin-1 (Macaca fascicularis) [Cotesia congregata]|uniref:Similar to ARRB1: Beta-arrestin-1 (Macaca fascicularis) n=1 Tax=Cotesia congregata TaxID=51543 RepID=A0A8J2MVB8_COTCN|nr:Similar to ARRB1: Beta-arrestin-1 (Macaca fascicularis) [Cotesia congregata]